MSPGVGGIQGGNIDPRAQGVLLPSEEVSQVSRPSTARIPSGAVVEGLVLSQEEGLYQVRVGNQTFSARSSLPLFVGQRFRAVWDASGDVPVLRLQASDLALLSRFPAKEQPVALALLLRGLPATDDVLVPLRQAWIRLGGKPETLSALVELWARGLPLSDPQASQLSWYLQLNPAQVGDLWKQVRERLRKAGADATPQEWSRELKAAREGNDDVARFLQAHSVASRPARPGVDPGALLAPMWWPLDDREDPALARVATAREEQGGRRIWRVSFETQGNRLGPVSGELVTNGRSLTVELGVGAPSVARTVRQHLPELEEALQGVPLTLQHLGVAVSRRRDGSLQRGVDMEA